MLAVKSDILTLENSINEIPPTQLIVRSDDNTPSAVVVQVRVLSNPLIDPSDDCEMLISGCGTEIK